MNNIIKKLALICFGYILSVDLVLAYSNACNNFQLKLNSHIVLPLSVDFWVPGDGLEYPRGESVPNEPIMRHANLPAGGIAEFPMAINLGTPDSESNTWETYIWSPKLALHDNVYIRVIMKIGEDVIFDGIVTKNAAKEGESSTGSDATPGAITLTRTKEDSRYPVTIEMNHSGSCSCHTPGNVMLGVNSN